MLKTTTKFLVILPTYQHDGTSNRASIVDIEKEISTVAGGYTEYASDGGWIDDATGQLYTDAALTVYTYCTDVQAETLYNRCTAWAITLQQIALTVEISTVRVAFVEGTRAQDIAA